MALKSSWLFLQNNTRLRLKISKSYLNLYGLTSHWLRIETPKIKSEIRDLTNPLAKDSEIVHRLAAEAVRYDVLALHAFYILTSICGMTFALLKFFS